MVDSFVLFRVTSAFRDSCMANNYCVLLYINNDKTKHALIFLENCTVAIILPK